MYWGLLLTIPWFTHIGKLSWFDCGYINLYTFHLVDDRGRKHVLDATYFSPFDTGFAKNRFYYTTDFPTIAFTYGQCEDVRLLDLVEAWPDRSAAANREVLDDYRTRAGMARYDAERNAAFVNFLRTFVRNKQAYDPYLISLLSTPPHMQQGAGQGNFTVPRAVGIHVDFTEKVVLPRLGYLPIRRDSFYVPLTPP